MNKYSPSILALLAIGMASTAHAQIVNIPVPNYNFSANGGQVIVVAAGTSTAVDDYTFSNPTNHNQFGALVGATVGDPAIAGNNTAGFINTGGSGFSTSFMTDTLSTNIAANTTYSFSIDIGNPAGTGNYANPGDVTFGLVAGNAITQVYTATGTFTLVPLTSLPENPNGTSAQYETFSYSFTTGAVGGFIGEDLEAEVIDQGPSYNSQTYFDNLKVTADAIPEPSTWAMMFTGLALLVGIQRFRRIA